MIDLDEQLAAYGKYLDTGQSVTVLHPSAVTAMVRPRRRVALVAATLVAIGGGVALVAVRDAGGQPHSSTPVDRTVSGWPSTSTDWIVVPDPDGVFEAQPNVESRFSNSVVVTGMTATDDGFVAVGYEWRAAAVLGVVWHSDDGEHWERAAHDASFGSLTADESEPGAMLFDIDENAGTVIVGGSETVPEDPRIWLSRDLRTWLTPHLPGRPDDDVVIRAVAAGPDGFVVAGVDVLDDENVDTSTVWFSPDGENWAQADLDDALGAHLYDVIAVDDGWYAAGSAASEAALWRSDDGTRWTRVDVAGLPHPVARYSRIWRLVEFDGGVVGYGNAGSTTDFVSGALMPMVWAEDDGRWAAAGMVGTVGEVGEGDDRLYAGPIVATSDGLIAFATDLTNEGLDVVELRSADGVEWQQRVIDLGGPRNAAAAKRGVVVAAGYAGWLQESDEEANTDGASSDVWIRDD